MTASIFEQFVTLWVVIDPIGTIPLFVAVTAALDPSRASLDRGPGRFHCRGRASVLPGGRAIPDRCARHQPAGLPDRRRSDPVPVCADHDLRRFQTERETAEATADDAPSPAIFPLAVPSIASPGAMLAVVLLTDNNRFSISEQVVTGVILMSVLACALVLMLLAGPILKLIGKGGAAIVSRVMGMILAAVAVDAVINAIFDIIPA
jgi:multiple antibiotic resistance protein